MSSQKHNSPIKSKLKYKKYSSLVPSPKTLKSVEARVGHWLHSNQQSKCIITRQKNSDKSKINKITTIKILARKISIAGKKLSFSFAKEIDHKQSHIFKNFAKRT